MRDSDLIKLGLDARLTAGYYRALSDTYNIIAHHLITDYSSIDSKTIHKVMMQLFNEAEDRCSGLSQVLPASQAEDSSLPSSTVGSSLSEEVDND